MNCYFKWWLTWNLAVLLCACKWSSLAYYGSKPNGHGVFRSPYSNTRLNRFKRNNGSRWLNETDSVKCHNKWMQWTGINFLGILYFTYNIKGYWFSWPFQTRTPGVKWNSKRFQDWTEERGNNWKYSNCILHASTC